jgi:hypothetical protein
LLNLFLFIIFKILLQNKETIPEDIPTFLLEQNPNFYNIIETFKYTIIFKNNDDISKLVKWENVSLLFLANSGNPVNLDSIFEAKTQIIE